MSSWKLSLVGTSTKYVISSSDSRESSQARGKSYVTLSRYLLELVYRPHISLGIFQKQPVWNRCFMYCEFQIQLDEANVSCNWVVCRNSTDLFMPLFGIGGCLFLSFSVKLRNPIFRSSSGLHWGTIFLLGKDSRFDNDNLLINNGWEDHIGKWSACLRNDNMYNKR